MTSTIQPFIEQRPHLKEPLEFYGKWQQFHEKVMGILPQRGATTGDARAYPPDSVVGVIRAFSSVFGLADDRLAPLARSLSAGEIDFMRLPLGETPSLVLPEVDVDPASLLFLLTRPFFLILREACACQGRQWEGGRCPLCSARPALSSVIEGPRRQLHCSWCGTTGTYRFLGCPNCGNEDASRLGTLVPDGEKGFRVATCDACHTCVKVVEERVLAEMTVDLADLVSLPLDIIAQEKGYGRRAPNPIGLWTMQ